MNFLLLTVRPDSQKITIIYRGQIREVVLSKTGNYPSHGSYCETHRGVAIFDNESVYGYRNSVHLIFKQKSYDIVANKQMVSHLTELFEKQVAADVKFVVKSQPIGAHVNVVVPFSPVMAAMLDNDRFQEGLTKTVHIDDMEPDVFKEMLRYLYTGKVPQLEKMTESLFVAADRFQIQGLKFLCQQRMLSKLNKNNAIRYLVLAHLHSFPELVERCYGVIVSDAKDIRVQPEWKQLGQSYPHLFFEASDKMLTDMTSKLQGRGYRY
jgi:speckle-type POZ protein